MENERRKIKGESVAIPEFGQAVMLFKVFFVNLFGNPYRMKRISLTLKDNEFQQFVDFLKSLHSVENFKATEISEYPGMSDEEIVNRVEESQEEIRKGAHKSQEEVIRQSKKW